ncbi:hypothetical protein K452DRAFT_235871 [Aplosporella prunicola CBS 121167]|uniref:Uncharacterized protein n=1 Tax=Aplosporella prunicola CBS 121167 TaxID=1176127 RepID=A0A6A6B1B8_9PEZI|nr:hypothetical protein K452DRAFT_235871 [Aplosporella prunicola CBS 121167]
MDQAKTSPVPALFAPFDATLRLVFRKAKNKTYNSWDSLVVTHLTTNQPVHSLYLAKRTGCLVLYDLWSYVLNNSAWCAYDTSLL